METMIEALKRSARRRLRESKPLERELLRLRADRIELSAKIAKGMARLRAMYIFLPPHIQKQIRKKYPYPKVVKFRWGDISGNLRG